jgi:NodT family efflux transporter outer membrane factor (OMF) lipoprotein
MNFALSCSPDPVEEERQQMNRASKVLVVLAGLAVLSACTVHEPPDRRPPVALPDSFSRTGKAALPGKWWTVLGDGELDRLVTDALSGNQGLRSTWDRLSQARALARREGAARIPAVDVTGGVAGSASGTVDGSWDTTHSYSVPFSLALAASYEVDLWGRVSSGIEAAELDVLASTLDLGAAAMTLSSEVASSWILILALRGQLRLLDGQVKTSSDFLEVVEQRFRAGRVSAADVLQQKGALEALRGERKSVQASLRVEENRLAVLLGRAPGSYRAPEGTALPELPPLPDTGTPAEWVRRRPDLEAAFLRLRAADFRVAQAVADRFPRLSLTPRASISWDANDPITSWLASLAANLLGPLVDGGRRSAEVDRAKAAASERLHAWGQVLLRALEEVENALVQEERGREVLKSLEEQLDLSRQALERLLDGYRKGTVDFTRFLTAALSQQRLERTVLAARRDLILHRIRLYRSLGGSWPLEEPGPKEES